MLDKEVLNEGFGGVTDTDWLTFLSQQPGIDEVNFWEFDNGEEYRALHGKRIWGPLSLGFQPSPDFLNWHNEHVFNV